MAKHIYSTLSAGNTYTGYSRAGEIPVADRAVTIAGGTGVVDHHGEPRLGVRTTISDADYEAIKDDHVFKLHVKNGFIVVKNGKEDPEKTAGEGMETAGDGGAQKRPEDFPETGPQPKVNKPGGK